LAEDFCDGGKDLQAMLEEAYLQAALSIFTKGSVLIFSFIFLHQSAGNIILPHDVACLWEDISKTSLIKPVSKTVLLL